MNNNILITGASFGIGFETTKLLSNNGFNIIALSRNKEKLNKLSKINSNIEIHSVDLTKENERDQIIKYISNKKIDILINNAGGGYDLPGNIINDKISNWRDSYELNVVAPLSLSQAVIPNMIKNNYGHIVFISSMCGYYVYNGGSNYTVNKHAEVALAKLLRLQFLQTPVKITEIAPGNVNSRKELNRENCLNPEDVAEAIKWTIMLPKHVNIPSMQIIHSNQNIF